MTTRLQRLTSRAARIGVRRFGESATRIRPVETVTNGQTVKSLTSDVANVRAVIAARTGEIQQQPWGQAAAGEHYALVDPDDDYQAGDLIDADEGAWEGERFRVTFVDRQASLVALERVHEGNE